MKPLEITPALIPHNKFHTDIWLLSVNRPEWYHFMKKRNPDFIKTKSFLKSVDQPLRKLVGWLHKKGIRTTPSCSGHRVAEDGFKKIYEALTKDAEEIRTTGLSLKDIESGAIYHYQNSRFKLLWAQNEFAKSAIAYQKKGVLGLRLGLGNRKIASRKLKNLKVPNVLIKERDTILFIFTSANSRHEVPDIWSRVTTEVIKTLKAQ